MRTFTVILYFIIAIVIFASVGITIPYCFESLKDQDHSIESLNQNIITYFIALLASASLDYILKLIDAENAYRKVYILLVCLFNIGVFIMTIIILYNNSIGKDVFGWAVLGVILSYIMWWIANYQNTSFNLTAPLGGDTNKALKNG